MSLEHTTVRIKLKTKNKIAKLVEEEKFSSVSAFIAQAIEEKLERLETGEAEKQDIYALLNSREGQLFIESAVDRALIKRATQELLTR
jgi:Arc/MetJ-type ribon-helix-helix transcriptional regulator